jgi:integration host factor subunit alpha
LTKSDLVATIQRRVGLTRTRSSEVVEQILELMKESLERGENIKMRGLGTFAVRQNKPRKGRDPQTGEEILLPACRAVTFKIGPLLKQRLNGDR